MNKPTQKYSASEFIEKLKSDDFGAPSLVFHGMVKVGEDENHLLFANGTYCSNWTAIPINIIESIDFIELVPCKDHAHPLVYLTIKEPTSEEAKMFASMARSNRPTGSFSPTGPFSMPMGENWQNFPQMFRDRRFATDQFFRNTGRPSSGGPDVWFPCWSHCMDEGLKMASQNPDHFWFWASFWYQLCPMVCP